MAVAIRGATPRFRRRIYGETGHPDDAQQVQCAGQMRLEADLRGLASLGLDLRDWRKLDPEEVIARYRKAKDGPENRTLLAAAVFVGTSQACVKGSYWAPSYGCPGAVEVECAHLRRPVSRVYPPDRMPELSAPERPNAVQIITCQGPHPLDVCAQAWAGPHHPHVAMVRFSSFRDPRNEKTSYTHCREDALFLRTPYYEAFERMAMDIAMGVSAAIDMGGLIYTPNVGVLRGPLDEGALWFREAPRTDVIWIGLPPRPRLAEQSQYADEGERNAMGRVIDRVFAWAAAHGVESLVLPPLGCGTHGCQHPELDVADLIHKAAHRYGQYISHVYVASDCPGHIEDGWWEAFARSAKEGRPPIHRPVKIPVPPFPRQPKTNAALAEKAFRLNGGVKFRNPRHTYL